MATNTTEMRLLGKALLVAALCGCSNATDPFDADERSEMRRAQARWTAAAISNYTLEQRRLCFCPPGWGEWARVTVRNGVVVSAVRVDDAAPIDAGGRITVEAMF